MTEFVPFPKIPRLTRECVVTEKIDGTNASVWVVDMDPGQRAATLHPSEAVIPPQSKLVTVAGHDYAILAGSRKRFITPQDDNAGFARWVYQNAEELIAELGYGTHFGEWWGDGIQRKYGLDEKRFSLFNTKAWSGTELALCHVVPTLYTGPFDTTRLSNVLDLLREDGSAAAPGFMDPEGIMIFHTGSQSYFKKTFEGDDVWKGKGS